jgi:ferric-dicitrate binding protein FerR (iron transport regulator)
LASAAAIALLALPLAGWVGWEQGWLPNGYQHVETTDQLRQVRLSDGSSVELNLHSELRYLNYKDERRVTDQGRGVLQGRARQQPPVHRPCRQRPDPGHRHPVQRVEV